MDLDQFKEINDALGHDHGRPPADRDEPAAQQVLLGEADTIARLGGDEFAVLLTTDGPTPSGAPGRGQAHHATRSSNRSSSAASACRPTRSIGIAVYPDHAVDAETLTQRADVAMYTAKRTGGGTAVYAPEHDQSSVRRLSLLGELRRAISDDELVLHYQPSVDLATGERAGGRGAGALAAPRARPDAARRVHRAGRGVGDDPVAHPMGASARAIDTVCMWREHGVDLPVAVNLSVRNLYDVELPAVARSAARRAGGRRRHARAGDHRERADGRPAPTPWRCWAS